MNTNNNVYTVVYTTVVCVLVAAILAFVSQSLKAKQEANEKAENISQILTAAQFGEKSHWSEIGNDATIAFYTENIEAALLVNAKGEIIGQLEGDNVYSVSDLKKQNYAIRDNADMALPFYIFKNGVSAIAIYGAGLWGPVWGYIALENDLKTIAGAYFDHESETPGLGGKIKDDPSFRAQFSGKTVDYADAAPFSIVKGGAGNKSNAIDAITGATMTSKGVDAAINNWLKAYEPAIFAAASCCGGNCEECQGECAEEIVEEGEYAEECETQASEEK